MLVTFTMIYCAQKSVIHAIFIQEAVAIVLYSLVCQMSEKGKKFMMLPLKNSKIVFFPLSSIVLDFKYIYNINFN